MSDLAKDMQSQVDFVVRRFQEMVTKIEELNKEVKDYSFVIQSYSETLSALNNSQVNLKSSLENVRINSDKALENSNSQIANHTSAFISVGVKLVKFEKDISELKNVISGLDSKLFNLNTKLDSLSPKSDIVDIKKYIDTTFDVLNLESKHFQDAILTGKKEKEYISNVLSEIKSSLNNDKKDIKNIISITNSLPLQLNQTKDKNSSDLENLKTFLLGHVSSSIAQIPKPIIPSLDEVQKNLASKLEPVTLDAQNAKLRSSNNEAKILLLEKKVENLQLLLNKLQLQG